jgi:hypothetical protein
MDGEMLRGIDRAALVHRLADDIDDAAQRLRPDGHGDRRAGIGRRLAADQAVGRVHGHGAHRLLAEMLRHLEHQPLALVLGVERVQDRGQLALELHIDHGAQDLGDLADGITGHDELLCSL